MRRVEDDEKDASHERWLVSYADFITLMFAFFVVLYATSEKDLAKVEEFRDSMKRYLVKAGAFGESGQQINQGDRNTQLIEPPIQTFRPSKPETVETLDKIETFVEGSFTAAERKKYIADISADEWGVRISMPAAELYGAGSEKFKPEAVKFLGKLSELLPQTKRHVLIEGHAAAGEVGGLASPWDFASARAVNMLRFVMKRQGLKPSTMAAASFGDSRPIFEGERAPMNSRVDIILLNQDMEL